jgi:hypothetical protein
MPRRVLHCGQRSRLAGSRRSSHSLAEFNAGARIDACISVPHGVPIGCRAIRGDQEATGCRPRAEAEASLLDRHEFGAESAGAPSALFDRTAVVGRTSRSAIA